MYEAEKYFKCDGARWLMPRRSGYWRFRGNDSGNKLPKSLGVWRSIKITVQ